MAIIAAKSIYLSILEEIQLLWWVSGAQVRGEPWLAVWRGSSGSIIPALPYLEGVEQHSIFLAKPSHDCQPPSHLHLSFPETAEAFAAPRPRDSRVLRFSLLCVFGALAKMPDANYLRSVSWGYIKVRFFWIYRLRGRNAAKPEQNDSFWLLCISLRSLVVGLVSSWIDAFKWCAVRHM